MGKSAQKKTSALLSRIYYQRCVLMQTLYKKIISIIAEGSPSVKIVIQIVFLGGGIDTSLEELLSTIQGDFANIQFKVFVLDFESVLARRDIIQNPQVEVKHISADLRVWQVAHSKLETNGFNFKSTARKEKSEDNIFTLIVEECVFCYIDEKSVDCILRNLAHDSLPETVFLGYSPLLSPQRKDTKSSFFASTMLEGFAANGASILSGDDSLIDREKRFLRSGWAQVISMDIQSSWSATIPIHERSIPPAEDPFDEFASLAVINRHYAITIASLSLDLFRSVLSNIFERKDNSILSRKLQETVSSSVTSSDKYFLFHA